MIKTLLDSRFVLLKRLLAEEQNYFFGKKNCQSVDMHYAAYTLVGSIHVYLLKKRFKLAIRFFKGTVSRDFGPHLKSLHILF